MTTTRQLNQTLGEKNNATKMKIKKKKRPNNSTNSTAIPLDSINSTISNDNLTLIPSLNFTDFVNNTNANQSSINNRIVVQENNLSLFGSLVGVTATAMLFFGCCFRQYNKKQLQKNKKAENEELLTQMNKFGKSSFSSVQL